MTRWAMLAVTIFVLAGLVEGQATRPQPPVTGRGPVEPIPATGSVPPIFDANEATPRSELDTRESVRDYRLQIRRIRQEHFGRIRVPQVRAAGLERIREFTDPAAFRALIEELADERDDVRLAVLDHLAAQGDEGQAALARVVIYDDDEALRNEATLRMVSPPAAPVLRELDFALRSPRHAYANNAGALAGTLQALDAIPLLIFSQATEDPEDTGDLAWIAVQTQTVYVQRLEPVVGGGAGAFRPIPGVAADGFVLQVQDAVVVVYRTYIHRSLVGLTTQDWGESTEHLGYNMRDWWEWYNREYVPFRRARHALEELATDELRPAPTSESDPGT